MTTRRRPHAPWPATQAPGIAFALVVGLAALGAARIATWLPPFPACVAAGAALATRGTVPAVVRSGLGFAASTLLRAGVVLLGFDLVFPDVVALGGRALAVVVAVVTVTFVGTRALARRLDVSGGLGTLVAVGFSICGISAIAAARGVVDADEDEVTFAMALVTLCGTLAIVVLPPLKGPLGLSPEQYGAWIGASVHDVGQVVATAATGGQTSLATAAVVKLTRVMLLAPLVALLAVGMRRGPREGGGRHRAVPGIVLLFVGAIALASLGAVPEGAVVWIDRLRTLLLAAALFAIGTRVDVRRLARLGARPLALGLGSWLLIAAIAYLGVRVAWR